MTKTKALYPGSFDPLTLGHLDIIKRLSYVFSELTVLIAHTPEKKHLFTALERKALAELDLKEIKNVRVEVHEGLTVNYCKKHKINTLVRGLRAISDFEYEMGVASVNRKLAPDIETLVIFSNPEFTFLSSRMVKEVAFHGGSLHGMVTEATAKAVAKKTGTGPNKQKDLESRSFDKREGPIKQQIPKK